MRARLIEVSVLTLLAASGCDAWNKGTFGGNGEYTSSSGGGGSGGDDTGGGSGGSGGSGGGDSATDSGDPGDDSGGDSSGGGDTATSSESFDEPGDVVAYEDEEGVATIDMSDESGDNNQDQEFYLIVVNTSDEDQTYDLRYTELSSDGASARPHAPMQKPAAPAMTPFRARLREARELGQLETAKPAMAPPPLDLDDVGSTEREFRVPNDVEDDSTYTLVDATLWAVGSTVAIWVDNDVPLDWDYECDGAIDQAHRYEAYGFDNCDLQTIADIVDTNIFPNVNTLFGDESDVNGDGLVSVVISPVLNSLPLTSEDEDDWDSLVESYADPEVDLTEWDAETNPASDEQEVIYVFAPDPYGLYNPLATTTVDEYTSMALASQIARAFEGLISYNLHVLENEGEAEEDWLDNALGTLAADLTGFGAVYYDDAWDYLDAPHLFPLLEEETEGSISTNSMGAQYLFARWLVDTYGTELLSSLVQTSSIGSENIEEATGEDFDDLVVRWQVALLTTGVTTDDGDTLVSDATYTPYAEASSVSAPTSEPSPGDYYGANGYQMGINIRDVNTYMEGGTTSAASENLDNRVLLNGTDHYTHVTGLEFSGFIEANYGAQVVRMVGVPYRATSVEIQGSSSGLVGAVVRWNDPSEVDYAVEDIFSPTDANNIEIPSLPATGQPVYAIGNISSPGLTVVVDSDGEETETEVLDTDRWLLDLSDRSGEEIEVAIWLDRRFDEEGDVSLTDPWLAIVPTSYVPTPSVDGTTRGACADGVDFTYPSSVLEYLYYQVYLSAEAFEESSDEEDGGIDPSEFDACGTLSEDALTCGDDWDLDGVADTDEPQPATFVEQVWVMQCTAAGGDASAYDAVTEEIFDEDSTDDDDSYSFNRGLNLGGQSWEEGEEAYMVVTLDGGSKYLLIVGAGDDTGSYEMTLQVLE